jgi:hypothetical protein
MNVLYLGVWLTFIIIKTLLLKSPDFTICKLYLDEKRNEKAIMKLVGWHMPTIFTWEASKAGGL